VAAGEARKPAGGRDYVPAVVTLADFRKHFGRVVTFEGSVQSVKKSQRGLDYAAMFEHKPWAKGLKLMFFRAAVSAVGGSQFIDGLSGRTVRVRGLLVDHKLFGPQIVVSERSMILKVD